MRTISRRVVAASCVLACACSSESSDDGSATSDDENTSAGAAASDCRAPDICVAGGEIGSGDGSASSVTLTEIYALTKIASTVAPRPVDLAFNPAERTQLWVLAYGDDSVHVGTVSGDGSSFTRYYDPAAGHFMHLPPALAMGDGGLWATCGNNDNSQNNPGGVGTDGPNNYFIGPSLFTTDLTIFATDNPVTRLGSHYDMLHSTPFCRGIAHVQANQYWVFNAYDGALDFYDFHAPHEPGGEDHGDGEIYRYAAGKVKGAADGVTPSHVAYDPTDKMLYIADTGNSRIVRLDTTKGTKGGPLPRRNEVLAGSAMMNGTDVDVVVAPGTLESPSGIEVKGDLVYVTDAAKSTFHVFRKDGTSVRKLATSLPAGSLSGFAFGPDKKIWFTDRVGGRVLRIDPN